MKLVTLLLTIAGFAVHANGHAQGITLSVQNELMENVFRQIEKQSGYSFLYYRKQLEKAKRITVHIRGASLSEALNRCFDEQPLTYAIMDRTIVVKRKEAVPTYPTSDPVATDPGLLTVKGKVTNEEGQPIPKASVMVKGKQTATATDANGEFELKDIEEKATLVISSVGYYPREYKVNGQPNIHIQLQVSISTLDETVVVAYNTTTHRANTGAVTVVKGEAVKSLPNRSVDRSLQGMVPGLLVTNGNGAPGGGVSNFVLRGIATGGNAADGSTVRNPLIVVDGVPVYQDQFQLHMGTSATPITNPMAQLNPADIESISVLKDASAISLYGARASNGVILITTKRGKAGKARITFNHQTDLSTVMKVRVDVLTKEEYLELLLEAYKNYKPSMTDDEIYADLKSKFPTKSDGSFYETPDWHNALYKKNATTFTNNLTVSGGNVKSNYYLNFEYTKQDGAVIGTGYNRQSFRFNLDNAVTDWFKVGLNSTFSYNKQDYAGINEFTTPNGIPEIMSPLNPIYLEDGNYYLNYYYGATQHPGSYPTPNPLAASEMNINRNIAYRGLSKIFGELSILKNLKLLSNLGVDFMLVENKEKSDKNLYDEFDVSVGKGRIHERALRRTNIISTNMLRYNLALNNHHHIAALVSYEAQIMLQKSISLVVLDFPLPYFDQLSNGIDVDGFSGNESKETLLSWLGQINYNFQNKYFLSASLRRDGSSRFGERKRFGTFWSLGAGWVATEENFLKGTSGWLSYLKFRGSIGAAGNAGAINKYTRFERLEQIHYDGNMAVYPDDQANPDVQWEQTFTWDAGLEARFLKDRFRITADIYKRNTSDLVYTRNLPSTTGYISVLDNIGNIENKGIELSIDADIIRGRHFRWTISANWSRNENKLIKANVPLASISGGRLANEEGRNFNSFYLVRWAGVDPTDGKPQWYDTKGTITKTYSTANRVFVGKPQPDAFGAVSGVIAYRQFELSATFYYQYGFQIYDVNLSMLNNDGRYGYFNQARIALDRWQKPGDIAQNPRRVLNSSDKGYESSTRYLFDGDFIRLNNMMLTYRLDERITKALGLTSCKVFIQGNNLALWSKYENADPSLSNVFGYTQMPYPNMRSFSFGFNVSF